MFIGVYCIISFNLTYRLALDLADCIFKSSTKYIFARVQVHGRKKFAQKANFFAGDFTLVR